ncbi:MAG: response regulator [Gemmatimonadaceae bacterium]|nr:response regulator [Gemmatimonadaceae bacterium]MCW5826292.1 response regulator [Gemmatimonadaceae bacterium]
MAALGNDVPQNPIVQALERWRRVLSGAVAVIAVLVIAAFVLERSTTRWVTHSGNVLRLATTAQREIWVAEAAVRALLLRPEVDSAEALRRVARVDIAQSMLRALRDSVADQPDQLARVDSILIGLDRWNRSFVVPVREGGILSRTLALEGTLAFDQLAHPFENLIEVEADLRVERFRRQGEMLWTAFVICLLALAVAFVAGRRLTAGLAEKARLAAEHQQTIEEQAAELEQQTAVLEEQAGQLEEQAAALEEKVAEQEATLALLDETSRFLDSAIESSPYGIAFYDRQLRFQRINGALAAINGYPAAEHIGKSIEQIIPALAPTIRPHLERVTNSGIAETDVVVEGTTAAHPDVPRRWLCTYYPIRAPGLPAVGVGCIVMDVTEQHRLEQQLRQAQKLEAVGRLAGGIAHDFNNVLTVIQSYAEVLAFELEEDGKGREEVDAIRAAADRAAGLARQLLAFSRRDVIIPRDVDLREVILGMQLILRRLVPPSVELTLDLADEDLVVRMDAGQLEQVLMNLAINAVDAMPVGGALRIRTAAGTPADDGVRTALLAVEDSGTGMTPEVIERLFEPFFTTKPAGRGTGLGLATTYAIITEAGGKISVSSKMGSGSRFDVLLPRTQGTDARERRKSPVRGFDVPGGSERILLAEDEPAIRTAISRILRAAGYDVLEASNGGEALRLADAESRPIHLLLSDVMMPGVGGKELVQRLGAVRPEVRIVMMSGYTDDDALRADLGAARYAFLQKPFTARDVLLAVRTALDTD